MRVSSGASRMALEHRRLRHTWEDADSTHAYLRRNCESSPARVLWSMANALVSPWICRGGSPQVAADEAAMQEGEPATYHPPPKRLKLDTSGVGKVSCRRAARWASQSLRFLL
jgi:hypothetical protein